MKKEKTNRLVVGDAGWAKSIPKWLLKEIKSERMIYGLGSIIKPDCLKVGDAEVMAYLMTTSLAAPLSREYTEVYVYLTAKMMKRRGKELMDFMKEKLKNGLTKYEEKNLEDIRSMIYDKRGGEVQHPVLNMLREMKKGAEREDKRLKKTGQARLL